MLILKGEKRWRMLRKKALFNRKEIRMFACAGC